MRIGFGNGDAAASAVAAGGASAAASSDHAHDAEGRFVAVEFAGFWLATVYVPNSGRDELSPLKRLRYRVGDERAGFMAPGESGQLPEGTPCW